MEAFDRLVPELMHRYNLPGGALAIVKDGRLVFARGYGLADIQNQEPVQPDSLFRIASLSKQVTAVAALKLVEDGKLDLDENAFEILSDFKGPEGASRDSRIDQITVRHLLHPRRRVGQGSRRLRSYVDSGPHRAGNRRGQANFMLGRDPFHAGAAARFRPGHPVRLREFRLLRPWGESSRRKPIRVTKPT